MGNVAQKSEKSIAGAIKINEKEIVDHLSQLVRQSVADTITVFLMQKQMQFVKQTDINAVLIGLIREQVRTNGNF